MRSFDAGGALAALPLGVRLAGVAGLVAAGLTIGLIWAMLADPVGVIEAVQHVLGAR